VTVLWGVAPRWYGLHRQFAVTELAGCWLCDFSLLIRMGGVAWDWGVLARQKETVVQAGLA